MGERYIVSSNLSFSKWVSDFWKWKDDQVDFSKFLSHVVLMGHFWVLQASWSMKSHREVKLLRFAFPLFWQRGRSSLHSYQERAGEGCRVNLRQISSEVTVLLSFSEITSVIWTIKHERCNLPEINYKLFLFSCLMIFMNQLEQKIALCKQNPEKTD